MVGDEVLNEVTRRLVDGFHPEKIILFGSQARGTADDRSDVDILVICRFEGRRQDVMLEMDRALSGMELAPDIVILTPEEDERDRRIPGPSRGTPRLREESSVDTLYEVRPAVWGTAERVFRFAGFQQIPVLSEGRPIPSSCWKPSRR